MSEVPVTTPPRSDWRTTRAPRWAETVLRVLGTTYPYGAAHVTLRAEDTDADPVRLHPAFHGSFDWHSSAHMQWSAVRLLTLAPDGLSDDLAARLAAVLDDRLTPGHGQVEAAYLRARPSYERPYGWAWAATLAAATQDCPHHRAPAWSAALEPVADAVADLLLDWLPRLAYPVRHGVHSNTAFAAALAHEAFGRMGRADVVAAVAEHARRWFAADRDYPAHWEPSGNDFLSPALCEADLMSRVLTPAELADWLPAFLPGLGQAGDRLLEVPEVRDRTDGQLVHLFGLGLSRAWQLRRLAPHLAAPEQQRVATATTAQVEVVEREIVTGDFMSTHWLVSFALLAASGS
ncbi:DUF2891 family protein [uncultured Friedmanniella sp.]|uniref:DUF2891 family protein n=1 Tax=uncultured Friedmanniella sp. TaxID=335381 RepID=UPI0035CB7411